MFDEYLDEVFLIVLVTFLFSALIMPLTSKIAYHIGAIDVPKDQRRVHKKPTPKLGGLGIFASFLFGYMLFGVQSTEMNSILIASFIMLITGIIDDIKTIDAKYQLLGHFLATCVVVFYGNILLSNITVFGMNIEFGIFAYPITIMFILGITNAIKLIDGLDGLSSGLSSIFYLTIGVISFFQGKVNTLETTLTFIMLGSTLGFLVHNFNPASLFAGEAGTYIMGFTIAIISLLGYKGTLITSIFVPVLILAIPILDTLLAIIRRKLKGISISEPDKEHLHHQIMSMNVSQKNTVLIIYAVAILFSIGSIFYALKDPIIALIFFGLLSILVIWFVLHSTILSKALKQRVYEFELKIKHKDKVQTSDKQEE